MQLTQKQKKVLGVSMAVIVVVAIVLLVYFVAIAPHHGGSGTKNIPGAYTPGSSTNTNPTGGLGSASAPGGLY